MQFKPVKNYKPPTYLAKAAALLAITGTLSGCADFPVKPVNPQGTEEVQLAGESVASETEPTTELLLDGDVAIVEETLPTTELLFDGDLEGW